MEIVVENEKGPGLEAIKSLVHAQKEMGSVLKNSVNPHFKSKYADLEAVIEACFEALHKNGFAIFQPCGFDDHGQYVDTVFAHVSGSSFKSRVHLVLGKNDMQGLGSAITYARRYGLLGLAGLAPEDDDGQATVKKPETQKTEAIKTSQPLQIAELARIAEGLDDANKTELREQMLTCKTQTGWDLQKLDLLIRNWTK